jgi:hypothetical protein
VPFASAGLFAGSDGACLEEWLERKTLFLLAANLGGASKGFLGLGAFLFRLLVMNTLMAASACGLFRFSTSKSTMRFWSGLTAAYSLIVGFVFLFGIADRLPPISG